MIEHPVAPDARGAYVWMDASRFVAAGLVVIQHVRDLVFRGPGQTGPLIAPWKAFYFLTGLGSEAVLVFFVLSGFWITSTIRRRVDSPLFWPGYLIDRLSRLWIVIVPTLVLGACCDAIGVFVLHSPLHAGTSGVDAFPSPVLSSLTLPAFLGNLAFVQTLVVPAFGSNIPLWSLAFEFWYYLWFPALWLLLTRRQWSPALLTLAMAVVAPQVLASFPVWLLGSVLAVLDARARDRAAPRWRRWRAVAGLGGGLGVFLASLAFMRLHPSIAGLQYAVGLTFALFLWALLRADPAPVVGLRPLAHYGAHASFSLYAMHMPLVLLLAALLGRRYGPGVDGGAGLGVFALLVVTAFLAAWLFAQVFEARTAAWRIWLRAKILVAHKTG